MAIDQLFQKKPTEEITFKILQAFGCKNFSDGKTFSKKDMDKMKTVEKLKEIKDLIADFYIPCKRKYFLNDNMTNSNALTILRHFLRSSGYTLSYREGYVNKEKVLIYKIVSQDIKKIENMKKKKGGEIKFIVKFN